MAIHPLQGVFAIAETNVIAGKIFILNYPNFQTRQLGKLRNTQVLHLTFSHQSLLACISSIRENTLTLWDFVKGQQIIEAQLNYVCPDIFEFCVTNENRMVGATERYIYVWTLESYGEKHHMSCRGTVAPRLDASVGFYEEPQDNLYLELISPEENPNASTPVLEVVSGMLKENYDEFQNYRDHAKRMKSISLTWTKEGFAIFGCRGGHLFMIDPASMAIGIVCNPTFPDVEGGDKEKQEKLVNLVLKPGDVDNLVYTKYGILCGGTDGRMRLLNGTNKSGSVGVPPVGLVAPSTLTTQNLSSTFLSTIQQLALSRVDFVDEEIFEALDSDHNGIIHMSACPNYHNYALLRKSGLVQVFQYDLTKDLDIPFSLHLTKQIRTNISPFTGLGGITIEDESYFVTCNTLGQVGLWLSETGEQVSSVEFTIPATCMKVIPGLPLAAIGFQNGALSIVYWVNRSTPRVLPNCQIFRSAIEEIYVDERGDMMLVTSSEPNIYVLSCEPRKEFKPLGYIVHESKIDSVAFARAQKDKILCIILDKRKKSDRHTNATIFTITDEILDDPFNYLYPNSYQLRDEALSMLSFKILLELSSAYLVVVDPEKKKKKKKRKMLVDELSSEESMSNEDSETSEDESRTEETKTVSTTILYSLTKSESNSCVLVMIDLTKEIADQTSAYRQYTRTAQHMRRSYSIARDFSSRLQPFLQARSNARRSILGSVTFEALSYRVPRPSITLQLNRLRREDKRDKKQKKETKPIVTGVETYQLTNVAFFYSTVSLSSTHVPGIIIASTHSGVFYILKVNETMASIIGYFAPIESTSEAIKVAVTRDFDIFAVAKRDGGYCAVELSDKLPQMDEEDLLAVERDAEMKRVSLMTTMSWDSNSSNDRPSKQPAVKDGSVSVENGRVDEEKEEDEDEKSFRIYKIDLKIPPLTWIERQFQKQRAADRQAMEGTRMRITQEFVQIKEELERMAQMNDKLTDLEKVAISEFELDSEERNTLTDETNSILQKKRADIEHDDLIKDFTHNVIRSVCWEKQEVKGRSLLTYDLPVEVPNYPIYPRTPEEIRLLKQAKCRRRVEIAVSAMYKKEYEKVFKKISSSESEKGSSDDIVEEEEVVSETPDHHLGSAATKFGISTKLLYDQMELLTNDQKLTQAVLIQDLTRKMRLKFNAEFDACLERKRQHIAGIAKRVDRINEIILKLDPNAPILSMDLYKLRPMEEAEALLRCADEEVDVERYRSPEELAAIEAAAQEEEERLRRERLDNWRERGLEDMMGGVLEVRREDELKKDIPMPEFVLAGKQEHEMSSEEKRIYRNYLTACRELEEEREKYRKYLEAEMRKNEASIVEAKAVINEDVMNLFNTYIQYEIALEMEDLKVFKLRASVLLARELEEEAKLYSQKKAHTEEKVNRLNNIIQQAKELVEKLQEDVELITVEDRMMEKGFRKDFHDVHGATYDIIHKAYKRRPKRLTMGLQLGGEEKSETDEAEERPQSTSQTEAIMKENANPYTEALVQCRSPEAEWIAMQRALLEFDEINKWAEFNIDAAVWERLYKARLKKAAKEMELKTATQRFNDTTAFLQRREKELADAMQELDELEVARSDLKARIYRTMTNVDINIVMPQGQVEIDVPPGGLVEDFNSCLLINRKQIEDLNTQVVQLSNEKISHIELIKSYKRRFKMVEWDLREMLMRYEDLVDRQKQITNFTITREIQRYLQNPDYESLVSAELNDSERTYAQLKANHKKHMDKIEERIKYYAEKQAGRMKKQNAKLLHDLEEMNFRVLEARHIYEQTPHSASDVIRAEACYKSLLRKANLETLTLHQSAELQSLRNELEAINKNKFPDIPY